MSRKRKNANGPAYILSVDLKPHPGLFHITTTPLKSLEKTLVSEISLLVSRFFPWKAFFPDWIILRGKPAQWPYLKMSILQWMDHMILKFPGLQ